MFINISMNPGYKVQGGRDGSGFNQKLNSALRKTTLDNCFLIESQELELADVTMDQEDFNMLLQVPKELMKLSLTNFKLVNMLHQKIELRHLKQFEYRGEGVSTFTDFPAFESIFPIKFNYFNLNVTNLDLMTWKVVNNYSLVTNRFVYQSETGLLVSNLPITRRLLRNGAGFDHIRKLHLYKIEMDVIALSKFKNLRSLILHEVGINSDMDLQDILNDNRNLLYLQLNIKARNIPIHVSRWTSPSLSHGLRLSTLAIRNASLVSTDMEYLPSPMRTLYIEDCILTFPNQILWNLDHLIVECWDPRNLIFQIPSLMYPCEDCTEKTVLIRSLKDYELFLMVAHFVKTVHRQYREGTFPL